MTTIRLTSEYEKKIEQIAKHEKKTKSAIIKKALERFFDEYFNETTVYERGQELFGKYGSGKGNLSKDYKKLLREKIGEKHTR